MTLLSNENPDKQSVLLNLFAFLFSFIGLFLYFHFRRHSPVKAKGIGTWALISFVLSLIGAVLIILLWASIHHP